MPASQLSGETLFTLFAAPALAYPISRALLWRYGSRIEREMRASAHAAAKPLNPAPSHQSPSQAPPSATVPTRDFLALTSAMKRMPWRAAAAEIVGGLAYATYHAWLSLLADQINASVYRMIVLTLTYVWPTFIAVFLVAGISRRDRVAILIGGAVLFLATVVWANAGPAGQALSEGTLLFIAANGMATLLLLAFLTPRVRAVGPMVLLVCLVAVGGAIALVNFVGTGDAYMRAAVTIGGAMGLGGTGTFVLLNVTGGLSAAVLGWLLLRILVNRYSARRLGEVDFTLGALWLTFALVHSIDLALRGWAWFALGVASFLIYWTVSRAVRDLLRTAPTESAPPALLLLRVFARGGPTTTLYRQISRHWRHVGPIRMIAGYDLAGTAIEPNGFMQFLRGRLGEAFIHEPRDADKRLAETAPARDPDGRFRVDEYFCHDDTWRYTLERLVERSSVVLMDLRGFTTKNEGCLFEVDRLIGAGAMQRSVLVFDRDSDLDLLKDSVTRTGFRADALPLFEWRGREHEDLDRLIETLARAAA